MDRERLRTAALAGLGLVAVGVGAAALEGPTESGGGRSGLPAGGNLTAVSGGTETVVTIPNPLLIAIALILVAYVVLAVLQDPRSAALAVVKMAAAGVLLALVLLALFQLGSMFASEGDLGIFGGGNPLGSGSGSGSGSGAGDESAVTGPTLPPELLFGLVVVALVGLGLALAGMGRTGSGGLPWIAGESVGEDDFGPDESDLSAIGAEAGRALARLGAVADADNEVYRTWREMTAQLGLGDPTSATPREFAAAAVKAGMAPALVEELTELFESVRYGGTEPTSDLETRARTVFGEIEARYDPDAGADSAETEDEAAGRGAEDGTADRGTEDETAGRGTDSGRAGR